ncbi:glutathione S-transferase family protein [Rhodoplanes sp. Z2-YC6860]|uniref:glutathione S-transferase family protein n=1 Tax=Rhodoplanes sp. Z2-YC6860 TaxID=674703 RepID=UPI00078BABB3|nr:glutathione S-transferase family protein [Rhodoplanes sp. Z2-YC6860]AMN38745.1 glutathione S-transferase [Rhodoplanes sp. Z2-YC6860]
MVQLVDSDIRTREVLGWKGVHVLHFSGSSCSQKLRIFLNLKGIAWTSHPVDLHSNDNFKPWFLGINPRGLVPVLVHDGAVHIESNDIVEYLEKAFPSPKLIPAGHENEVAALLRHEDDLHLDLRTLSFRFVFNPPGPPKPPAALESYAANGAGTVQGAADHGKNVQIEFWQRAAKEGFTDERARASARKFRAEFDAFEQRLASAPYLMGEELSVLDIAWFIYAHRLSLGGYPLARLHPRVQAWKQRLGAMPEFAREIVMPDDARARLEATYRAQAAAGKTLEMVAGF